MVKHFNVIMAGVISGIVALFTSFLGFSGTIIGSVLSSFLYQLLSSYSQEKYDERLESGKGESLFSTLNTPDFAREIVYIFPLVVILLIELLYCLTSIHYGFTFLFNLLEAATANNLFRVMGIALVVLSIYPFFDSNNIQKSNGSILMVLGILVFLRGIVDLNSILNFIYSRIFARFDLLFAILVILAIVIVILSILRDSTSNSIQSRKNSKDFKPHKVDVSGFNGSKSKDEDKFTNAPRNHVSRQSYNPRPSENYPGGGDLKHHVPKSNGDFEHHVPKSNGDLEHYAPEGNGDFEYHVPKSNGDLEHYAPEGNGDFEPYGSNANDYVYYEEDLPIYEEDYIYVENPENPNQPIRRKILRKVKKAPDEIYHDGHVSERRYKR